MFQELLGFPGGVYRVVGFISFLKVFPEGFKPGQSLILTEGGKYRKTTKFSNNH